MFCNHCGKPLAENAAFCPHCGTAVFRPRQAAAFPQQAEFPTRQDAVSPQQAESPDQQKDSPPETTKHRILRTLRGDRMHPDKSVWNLLLCYRLSVLRFPDAVRL